MQYSKSAAPSSAHIHPATWRVLTREESSERSNPRLYRYRRVILDRTKLSDDLVSPSVSIRVVSGRGTHVVYTSSSVETALHGPLGAPLHDWTFGVERKGRQSESDSQVMDIEEQTALTDQYLTTQEEEGGTDQFKTMRAMTPGESTSLCASSEYRRCKTS
jgi:hypothetical protein